MNEKEIIEELIKLFQQKVEINGKIKELRVELRRARLNGMWKNVVTKGNKE